MRYFVIENRLIASGEVVPNSEEITKEAYELKQKELYANAEEYFKNNPPVEESEEATETEQKAHAYDIIMGVTE